MKHRLLLCVAAMLLTSSLFAEDIRLSDDTRLRFSSVDEGQKILTTEDDYLKQLSPFDRAARLETDKPVTLEQFKEHLAAQVLSWNEEQESQLRPILASVADKLKPWKLNLPETIQVLLVHGRQDVASPRILAELNHRLGLSMSDPGSARCTMLASPNVAERDTRGFPPGLCHRSK